MADDIVITAEIKAQLGRVGNATIATELFNRGLRNVFLYGLFPLNRAHAAFVAEAFTLRYIPCREDIDVSAIYRNLDHPQRVAIETCPPGHALVMDSRGDPRAASAGEILAGRLMRRGVAALVTDGSLRDSIAIEALPFPSFVAGRCASTNLARHHAVDLNVPIACAGVPVYPGDVLVGDAEGICVVPRHMAADVAAAAVERDIKEEFVTLKLGKTDRPIFGIYPFSPEMQSEYDAWRKARG